MKKEHKAITEFTFTFHKALNDYYRKVHSKNVKRGLRAKKKRRKK